ncbi:MAG: hypothetical protein JWP70_2074 [Leifsonia sp.]|jgi:hypothetical protein|nr:hypothetical protein [Leifsonia sp.]MDQ1586939.1 hypothetical protein [Microbacteriaceae bacterium]
MSTIKHPVGPQPSKVYWRRRLIVGLGALAVIVIVVLIFLRPGSSKGSTAPTPTPTSSTKTATPESTTIPTSATTASGAACKAANVDVQAITDASSYAAGKLPQLSLSVTNTGTTACKLNAGSSQQVYTITSGTEVYWKSTDCQSAPVDAEILLQPGKTIKSAAPIAWDRTRSDPKTCTAQRSQVPAAGASYHLKVSVAGIASKTTKQFALN